MDVCTWHAQGSGEEAAEEGVDAVGVQRHEGDADVALVLLVPLHVAPSEPVQPLLCVCCVVGLGYWVGGWVGRSVGRRDGPTQARDSEPSHTS